SSPNYQPAMATYRNQSSIRHTSTINNANDADNESDDEFSLNSGSPAPSDGGRPPPLLYLRITNAKVVCSLLKTIQFRDLATICASVNGLKVTVEDCKSLQANVYLQTSLFSQYTLRDDEPLFFKLNYVMLLECLQMFSDTEASSPAVMELFLPDDRSAVELHLEDAGVVTDCRIRTIEPEQTLDFNFNAAALCFKVIIRSEQLKEVFSELDPHSELVEIFVSTERRLFRMSTFGDLGRGVYDFPAESEAVEMFQSPDVSVAFRYRHALLKCCLKALQASAKASIRCDQRGFLSLQFLVESADGHNCFIEFFLVPNQPEDEDEIAGSDDERH
ncbi:hypothetical protein BOX15_Mlig026421g1, partial [Macrostomum lignano]